MMKYRKERIMKAIAMKIFIESFEEAEKYRGKYLVVNFTNGRVKSIEISPKPIYKEGYINITIPKKSKDFNRDLYINICEGIGEYPPQYIDERYWRMVVNAYDLAWI